MVVARHPFLLFLCCALPATALATLAATPLAAQELLARTAQPPVDDDGADAPPPDIAPARIEDDAVAGADGDGDDDSLGAKLRGRTRFVARDGDLAEPLGPAEDGIDGVIVVGEPEAPLDGLAGIDIRRPAEVAAFEGPPAGFDPLLFQIEELNPLRDRRTRRLFNFEPYDPIGIRIGSFVLFPEAELSANWTSNVLLSPDAKSDTFLEARPAGRLVSNWGRHALELRAAGSFTTHDAFDSENDRGYLVEARGRLDFLRHTNLQLLIGREMSQESRSAIDANAVGDRADVTVDRAEASFNHRFNRLSIQVRGGVASVDYGPTTTGGITVSNADRDYRAYDEALRATWQFKPHLAVFAEVGLSQRTHDEPAASDGLSRDSTGERFRLGVAFGEKGPILRGEASIGYGRQRPDDHALATVEGVLIDANVAWRVTGLTSLNFTAQTEFAETTTPGASGALVRQAGVEVRHAFRRYLIATAGVNFYWADYAGVPIDETELRATLGVEYYLSRETILFARYAHVDFDSTEPDSDYTAEEVKIGVRLRR